MSSQVAILLAQNAFINGAIYALLALALVMVFSVTRVIFIPQGEIVSLAALSLAALEAGHAPATIWLLCAGGALAAAMELASWRREMDARLLLSALAYLLYPAAVAALVMTTAPAAAESWYAMALTLLVVAPFGPIMYRVVFRPLAAASVLSLLIAAMAVHFVLIGFGLIAFGAEGVRTAPAFDGVVFIAGAAIKAQAIFVACIALVFIAALALFFGRTLTGKALRATAFNRTGARLVGVRPESAGALAFLLAGVIGGVSGLLIAPMTTMYFDTGFLIGLKGFIAAIGGGLGSYPLAAVSALVIGLAESYASFWASAFKDVIVFALIIPVLLWRNLGASQHDEEEA